MVNLEVLIPLVQPGMEEARDLPGYWIKARKVGAFEFVAVVASECEVVNDACSPVLLRNDMFNVMGELRRLRGYGSIRSTHWHVLARPGVLRRPLKTVRFAVATWLEPEISRRSGSRLPRRANDT